jgi:hypothetical protein
MPLFSNPHHTCTTYGLASGTDSGGGTSHSYTAAQSSVPCEISTASASTVELYAQQNIRVSHTVAFLSSKLTTAIVRGMKIADTSGRNFHIEGIRTGRAAGNVPAFTYADCTEIL